MHSQPEAEQQVVAAPNPSAEHWLGLDACRVIAALGVVWLHVSMSLRVDLLAGRFGVPYFTLLAACLATRMTALHPDRQLGQLFLSRVKRVLRPFALWSAIVFVVRFLKWKFLPGHDTLRIAWFEWLLEGTSPAYWFLPFVFVVSVLALALGALCARRRGLWPALAFGMFAAAVLLSAVPSEGVTGWLDRTWASHALDMPGVSVTARWWVELPLVFASLSLALVFNFASLNMMRPTWSLCGVFAVALGAITFGTLGTIQAPFLDHITGLLLFGVACTLPVTQPVKWLAGAGRHAYTVYLSHVLWTWPFIMFGERALHHPGAWYMVVAVFGVAGMGTLTALFLESFPALAMLLP